MAGDPWRREEGKVPDGGRPAAGAGGPLRLRDWLVLQIESGNYRGLCWEDEGKTLFRIPWKHAAKQGYQAQQDAALFRAWAIYKGKHLEGTDKEDPSTWKTRLRCALNKSVDFREMRERSQLDISNPYKVYQIVSDSVHGPATRARASSEEEGVLQSQQEPLREVMEPACRTDQAGSGLATEDENREQPPRLAQQGSLAPAALLLGPLADHRYQAPDPSQFWSPLPSEDFSNPDCWLHVRLFYGAELVGEATACTAEGCRLGPRAAVHSAAERLLGPPREAQVRFPEPPPGARVLQRLLPHLERGVLLWVAPEGVFAKRLCQGRVYWRGPLAPHRTQPNKLERERTCQLLDTRRFLAGPPAGWSPRARVPDPSMLWRGVPGPPGPAPGAAHHGPRGTSLCPRAPPALEAPQPQCPGGQAPVPTSLMASLTW